MISSYMASTIPIEHKQFLNNSTRHIYGILTGNTTLGQSESERNGNEEGLHTLQMQFSVIPKTVFFQGWGSYSAVKDTVSEF